MLLQNMSVSVVRVSFSGGGGKRGVSAGFSGKGCCRMQRAVHAELTRARCMRMHGGAAGGGCSMSVSSRYKDFHSAMRFYSVYLCILLHYRELDDQRAFLKQLSPCVNSTEMVPFSSR